MDVRYLGIDPGMRVGIVGLDDDGTLIYLDAVKDDTKIKQPRMDPVRLASITRRTQQSINKADLGNDLTIALEEPFLWRGKGGAGNANSLKTYGVFSVFSQAFQHRVEEGLAARLVIVPPTSLKSFLGCGKDKGKHAVAALVKERWGFEHKIHDVVDAYALAQYAREN